MLSVVLGSRSVAKGSACMGFYYFENLIIISLNTLMGKVWTTSIFGPETKCTVFRTIQSPSAQWIEYTRLTNHTWWKLFGAENRNGDEELRGLMQSAGGQAVLSIGGERQTIRDVFAPCLNRYQRSEEIAKILRRFNAGPTEHPCLILFKDLKDRRIWFVDLRDLVGVPERQLARSLQEWFGVALIFFD